ncbi:MAG: ABC transporter permease [bacterium]|nr:ABC transporter permease [bacterium]
MSEIVKKQDSSEEEVHVESPGRIAFRRFLKHKLAVVGSVMLICIFVTAFGAPIFTRYNPLKMDLSVMNKAPSLKHWCGTDELGRDVLARVLYGGRVSLLVGLAAAAISTIIGLILGSISGYYGKAADMAIMRVTDVMMTFPPLIIMLTVASLAGPGILNIIFIIGGLRWPPTTRLVRGQFLSLKNTEYIQAAQVLGLPDNIIIRKHCLPNIIAPLMARVSFAVSAAILSEAGLSFLGIGVPLPTPTWGNMMQQARNLIVLRNYPWIWIFPAMLTLITIMSINFIGDGLRDAFDPQQIL